MSHPEIAKRSAGPVPVRTTHAKVASLYLRERYPARRFVPLASLLGGTGMLAARGLASTTLEDAAGAWLRAALLAYLLVLAVRVWDDLEDREHDAPLHPRRITVRVTSATPFLIIQGAAAALAAVLVLTGPQPGARLLMLLVLGVVLGLWYRFRKALGAPPIAGALVVLSKYPAIAYVAAPVLWSAPSFAYATPFLLALYVALCVHEVLDDPALRGSFGRGSPS